MYGHVVFDLKNAAYFYGGGAYFVCQKDGVGGPQSQKIFFACFHKLY